jgi:precorrin-8X/cobalt-precorrin-8 methylmutase
MTTCAKENNNGGQPKPLVHDLFENPMSGAAIEAASFAAIDKEAGGHGFSADQWEVVRRMIHTTADFSLAQSVKFSPDAIEAAVAALARAFPIYVDSHMIRSGISLARLRSVNPTYTPGDLYCHVADPDVAREAAAAGLPRSIFAVQKARRQLDGGIAVFGNAPAALLELNRLIIEENIRPALVIAVPVGFVHVIESKAELMNLGVPFVALEGRRGGSPLAVSILHALCTITAGRTVGDKRADPAAVDAVILLGHGSRVENAGRSMEMVGAMLKEKYGYRVVETCHMSRLGPHFPEAFDKCLAGGARHILLIPYFLHEGVHMKMDIPGMMQERVARHPEIRLVMGRHLGFDTLLADLVQKRIEESARMCDVREIVLPEEDAFPIPPGQCEFVAMLPAEAARWREMTQKNKAQGHCHSHPLSEA